jgi:hypothetical protein
MEVLLTEAEQRLVADIGNSSSARIPNSQNLCNLSWSIAVLDLQQHAQQVLRFAQSCSSIWSSTDKAAQQQLWQVNTLLLDLQLAGGQGLQGSLIEQQLQQCRAAWDQQMQETAKQQHTEFQRSVFAAVQRLGIAWQQQPQMEQLSVGRDSLSLVAATPDGALLLDIAGRTAAGVLVAVEADGPTHFRRPDRGLMGTTQYRNRALAVRGYRLVSVHWSEWRRLKTADQQEEHLMALFRNAGIINQQQEAPQQQQQKHGHDKQRSGRATTAAQVLLQRAGLRAQATTATADTVSGQVCSLWLRVQWWHRAAFARRCMQSLKESVHGQGAGRSSECRIRLQVDQCKPCVRLLW